MEWSIHFSVAWLSTAGRASVGTPGCLFLSFFQASKQRRKSDALAYCWMTQTQPPILHIIEKRTRLLPELLAGYTFMNSRRWKKTNKTKTKTFILLCKIQAGLSIPTTSSPNFQVDFFFFFWHEERVATTSRSPHRTGDTIFSGIQYLTRRKLASGPVAESSRLGEGEYGEISCGRENGNQLDFQLHTDTSRPWRPAKCIYNGGATVPCAHAAHKLDQYNPGRIRNRVSYDSNASHD